MSVGSWYPLQLQSFDFVRFEGRGKNAENLHCFQKENQMEYLIIFASSY
jgi:hypothetical protein